MKRRDFDFELAKTIHNNFYTYDKVICKGFKKNVIITCPKHGDFLQMPHCHIVRKQGCKKCQYEKNSKKFTFTKEEFVYNATKVHGEKYNYDETVYINSHTKVKIKCKLHGDFTQTPLNHTNCGKGCPKCKSITLSKLYTLSTKSFIDMAKSIHGEEYDYSKVEYIGMKSNVTIICKKHGEFSQKAGNHIYIKNGCPHCGNNVSVPETEWLDSLNIPKKYRQKILTIDGTRYKFDAYDKNTKTVYEYFGSFFHGNPEYYNPNDINPKVGITYGELYNKTLKKIKDIESHGFKLISKWGK